MSHALYFINWGKSCPLLNICSSVSLYLCLGRSLRPMSQVTLSLFSWVQFAVNPIVEFPVSVTTFFNSRICIYLFSYFLVLCWHFPSCHLFVHSGYSYLKPNVVYFYYILFSPSGFFGLILTTRCLIAFGYVPKIACDVFGDTLPLCMVVLLQRGYIFAWTKDQSFSLFKTGFLPFWGLANAQITFIPGCDPSGMFMGYFLLMDPSAWCPQFENIV